MEGDSKFLDRIDQLSITSLCFTSQHVQQENTPKRNFKFVCLLVSSMDADGTSLRGRVDEHVDVRRHRSRYWLRRVRHRRPLHRLVGIARVGSLSSTNDSSGHSIEVGRTCGRANSKR